MRASKFVTINENILLEYIYDDANLIGEPYNILTNTVNGFKCFISADEQNPPRRGFKQTNNTLYNQLYRIDVVNARYGKVPVVSTQANTIDTEKTSFLQIQNYPTSVPIRYDKIKVHIPVDYTFGELKGFALRIYTYDFNDKFQYEISNYYFDMTDVEQNYKLEFSSPLLYQNEKSWGKYLEIQVPSVTKISDQRVQNVTKENTINWNLTGGIGLSKNAPVFIDFQFIESIDTVNGGKFFNLFDKKTVVVPQTPDFENLGVVIDESSQGDFFLIYGTYNGTLAEFENWIDESYYYGNKYYVEFVIDIYEKNVKTKTTNFVLLDDFGEEIEFRPILKFTTTTAVIDVTMKVIDFTDGTTITRKASYGLLQGGGQKMGAEPNDRLGTGNFSGGAGDISKYARSLSKINLKGAKKPQIIGLKTIMLSTTGDDPFGTRPILELVKSPYSVFGDSFFVNDGPGPLNFGQLAYQPNNGSITYIYPFDNLITFKILTSDEFKEVPYNLNLLTDLKITMKSDNKDLSFGIYKESSYNDLENGKVIFKIPQGSYLDIKKLSNQGFDLFYINGLDEDGNKVIVYSAFFLPFDSVTNINKLEADYRATEDSARNQTKTVQEPVDLTANVRDIILQDQSKPKGVNTSTTNQTSKSSGFSGASFNFAPRWKAYDQSILLGNSSRDYEKVLPTKALTQMMLDLGLTKKENLSSLVNKFKNKSKGFATAVAVDKSDQTDKTFQLVLGYFKGLNLKLTPDRLRDLYLGDLRGTSRQYDPGVMTEKIGKFSVLIDNLSIVRGKETFKKDLDEYILSGKTNKKTANGKGMGLVESEVRVGEFLPLDKREIEKIKNNQIYEAVPKPRDTTKGNLQAPPIMTSPNTSTSGLSGNSFRSYNPNG
jgi:hypothetical protein